MQSSLVPVILSGGDGTRLWPLSRASYPKQYWPLTNDMDQTLLQQTQQRLNGLPRLVAPLIVCNEEHRFIVAEQMRQIGIKPMSILLEPIGRSTAPAITLAALHVLQLNIYKDPLLLILAADHMIYDDELFRQTICAGIAAAEEGKLVSFGIKPTDPEIGFGYIETRNLLPLPSIKRNIADPVSIVCFTEKPNKEKAKEFLITGKFNWNSGIFLFRASSILSELQLFAPSIVQYCSEAISNQVADLDFLRIEKKSFGKCPSLAIDVAVMEKTKHAYILPLESGWSDIGNWSALWKTAERDCNGNFIQGRVIQDKARNCYLHSEHRLLVGLGIENLIVVETNDAILVASHDQAQHIKKVVTQLLIEDRSEAKDHHRIYRPWGYYDGILSGDRWQVKKIQVQAGATLSLQMHHHRSEHWVVVKGTALISKDGVSQLYGENQSIYIPFGCQHRLSNPGRMPVELIEVQSGSYLNEDDIIRINAIDNGE
uniref:mannose-1-phosphate guanylyltransferase n=1 Tax=Paulinella longichromatophora TaxID=1708747 RepID=A0A2H4ZPP6_9EUKA|nr:GDP-mannose pyrophosphorylase [Paulinella longichromatophora]